MPCISVRTFLSLFTPATGTKQPFRLWTIAAIGLFVAAGCESQPPPAAYAVRVGDTYLYEDELNAALDDLPPRLDSVEARRQFIDQWVTNELLYQEALRRNIREQPDVQQRLKESERAVLIDALVSQLFEEEEDVDNPVQMRTYFERNKEQLRLREPFVHVRYLYTSNPDSAQLARKLLQEATKQANADTVWLQLVSRFSEDPELSLTLSTHYFPESRLFMEQQRLHESLSRLGVGNIAPLIQINEHTHLLQLIDRAPTGAIPELSWIEDQVRRQLTIDNRKQMYERQVQRLRTEATSRDAIEIRNPSTTTDDGS